MAHVVVVIEVVLLEAQAYAIRIASATPPLGPIMQIVEAKVSTDRTGAGLLGPGVRPLPQLANEHAAVIVIVDVGLEEQVTHRHSLEAPIILVVAAHFKITIGTDEKATETKVRAPKTSLSTHPPISIYPIGDN